MSLTVIKVENLSKQYRLGEVGAGSMRDDFIRWRYRMMGREDPFLTIGDENDRTVKSTSKYVWALKDINFEVKQGEILGIIGRNGAGKSTLLKILSRTTGPTVGSVKIKGRIASLLEVGTGFHSELSGRENIYLNGAIMGMRKHEITKKLDEIIDFAGVEKYIDTPVKRYSSGMYVRLAFGVAAHLDPDIMILDEVLSVGDAEFQKKALGKMKDVSTRDGRTVLFVSHNMVAIQNICQKAMLLGNGRVKEIGETGNIINKYFSINKKKSLVLSEINERTGNSRLTFTRGTIKTKNSEFNSVIDTFSDVIIELEFVTEILDGIRDARIDIGINNNAGDRVAWLSSDTIGHTLDLSNGKIKFCIADFPIAPGDYDCNLYCEINKEVADWIENVLEFTVTEKDYYKTGKFVPSNQGDLLLNYSVVL
ncbi:MAG: ABC transporter ATP-binding protein [Bacteroidota bacterium]|nr:ABC transporter ATP-binding protein [Bacteroidota bacterium]